MKILSTKKFINNFEESFRLKNGEKYCFILGAGASKQSKIRTGIELARIWYNEIQDIYEDEELIIKLNEMGYKSLEAIEGSYFELYSLRFYGNKNNGYAFMEKEIENKSPSCGYYVLSKILADDNKDCNLVITTNFDSLVEDALFIYTNKKPIVANHENLAEYVKVNTKRPIIAKIHRGLYFEPLNKKEEISSLSAKWETVLQDIFQNCIPIVIGYAGGDNSLLGFMKKSVDSMKGIYWCKLKNSSVSKDIQTLVNQCDGYFVDIEGFDELMIQLMNKLGYENPSIQIQNVANERIKLFNDQFSQIYKTYLNKELNSNEQDVSAIIIDSFEKELELLNRKIKEESNNYINYFLRANIYLSLENYQLALEDYNKVIRLNPRYVYAYNNRGLTKEKLFFEKEALKDYNKALKIDQNCVEAYNNRGKLYFGLNRYEEAYNDYNKAIELDPENVEAYNNRGNLKIKLSIIEEAYDDFNKAIELDPEYVDSYINRGNLYSDLNRFEEALEDYNKAIELDPECEDVYHLQRIIKGKLKMHQDSKKDIKTSSEMDHLKKVA